VNSIRKLHEAKHSLTSSSFLSASYLLVAVERLSITALTLLVARASAHKEAGSTYLQSK